MGIDTNTWRVLAPLKFREYRLLIAAVSFSIFATGMWTVVMALQVIDDAIQAFGGAGVSGDTPLAELYAGVRTLRIADGPDEVHKRTIAQRELRRWAA